MSMQRNRPMTRQPISAASTLGTRPLTINVTITASPSSANGARSEEHTSELQSLMRISYAVFCLKKKKNKQSQKQNIYTIQHNKQDICTKNNSYQKELTHTNSNIKNLL